MNVAIPFLKFALVPLLAWLGFWRARHLNENRLRPAVRLGAGFLAGMSTLYLVTSLPTGSIDISGLWRFLAYGLLSFIALLGFILTGHIKPPWIKISIRTASSLLIIPAGLFLTVMSFSQATCVKRSAPIYSPDGRHIALIEYLGQGALGDDDGLVSVRRAWTPTATTVYSGLGYWYADHRFPNSPEVRWLDSSHLSIRYDDGRKANDGRGGPAICKDSIGSVQIVCQNLWVAPPN